MRPVADKTRYRHRRTHEASQNGEIIEDVSEHELDIGEDALGSLEEESPEAESSYSLSNLAMPPSLPDYTGSLGGMGATHMGPPPQMISANNY